MDVHGGELIISKMQTTSSPSKAAPPPPSSKYEETGAFVYLLLFIKLIYNTCE